MNYAEYAALPGVRASHLKALATSPKQYQHSLTADSEGRHFTVGTGAHMLVLEPERFGLEVIHYPHRRQGKNWEAFKALNSTKTILSTSEFEAVKGIAEAIWSHPVAAQYLTGGEAEHALTWTDGPSGLPMKCLVDFCSSHQVELKTTSKLPPRQFASQSARLGYHIGLAHYREGIEASGLDLAPEPIVITVDSKPPHDVIVYEVPEHVVDAGRADRRALIDLLIDCTEKDEWPGMAPEIQMFELPAWATPDRDLVWDLEPVDESAIA